MRISAKKNMTINCKGKLIDLSSPKVMGILNLTPDSFYDGGKFKNETAILNHVAQMLQDGATFIDMGAYSSRPNAEHISETEELNRLLPILDLILKEFPETLILNGKVSPSQISLILINFSFSFSK